MAEDTGDKTEQPTARHLEKAWNKGQFARSAEIQTVCVVMAGTVALLILGTQTWSQMHQLLASIWGISTTCQLPSTPCRATPSALQSSWASVPDP